MTKLECLNQLSAKLSFSDDKIFILKEINNFFNSNFQILSPISLERGEYFKIETFLALGGGTCNDFAKIKEYILRYYFDATQIIFNTSESFYFVPEVILGNKIYSLTMDSLISREFRSVKS